MPIPAIPIVVGVLAGAGGLSLGALIRQPQINTLTAEIVKLQEELGRMQSLANDVMKDIEILKLKMQLQQNEDLLAQLNGRDELDIGYLVYAYGLKEYLEIKQNYLVDGKDITEAEALFVDSFTMFLDNKVTDDNNGLIQKRYIREYLKEKYSEEIKNLTPPDLNAVIVNLESKIEEAKAKAATDKEAKSQSAKARASTFSGITLGDALRFAWMDATFAVERKAYKIHRNRVRQSKDAAANGQQANKGPGAKEESVGKYYGLTFSDAIKEKWLDATFAVERKIYKIHRNRTKQTNDNKAGKKS